MGFIRDRFGNITIESRSESFRIHPNYGYTEDGSEHDDSLGAFGIQWRESSHPEFLYDDLDDLIEALGDLRHERRRNGR